MAQVINTGMCTYVSQNKIKLVLEKYPTPANTPNVCIPKMNTEIWEVLPSFTRMRDVALQRLVTLVVKSIVISAEMLIPHHMLAQKRPGADVSPDISRLLQSRGETVGRLPGPSQGCSSILDKSSEPTEPSIDTVTIHAQIYLAHGRFY